jgi:hypothetical protein
MARRRHYYDDEGNYLGTSVPDREQAYLEIGDRYRSRLARVGMRVLRFPLRGVGPAFLWLVGFVVPLAVLLYIYTTFTLVALVVFALAAVISEAAKGQPSEPDGVPATWKAANSGPEPGQEQPGAIAALPAAEPGAPDRVAVLAGLRPRRAGRTRIAIIAIVLLTVVLGLFALVYGVNSQIKVVTHQNRATPQTLDSGISGDGGFQPDQPTTSTPTTPTPPPAAGTPSCTFVTATDAQAALGQPVKNDTNNDSNCQYSGSRDSNNFVRLTFDTLNADPNQFESNANSRAGDNATDFAQAPGIGSDAYSWNTPADPSTGTVASTTLYVLADGRLFILTSTQPLATTEQLAQTAVTRLAGH